MRVEMGLLMFLNHLRVIWHVLSKRNEIQQEQSPDVDLRVPRKGERDHRLDYLVPLLYDRRLHLDYDLMKSYLRLNCQKIHYLHLEMTHQQI